MSSRTVESSSSGTMQEMPHKAKLEKLNSQILDFSVRNIMSFCITQRGSLKDFGNAYTLKVRILVYLKRVTYRS